MSNTDFYAIASAMALRGVPVMPIKGKVPFLSNFPKQATIDLAQIKRWGKDYPGSNVGCVALAVDGGYWFLDDDQGTLVEKIEAETGETFPATFKVKTSRGYHYYFKQTLESIAMGNVVVPGMEARVDNYQVVGPGSRHPSGITYTIASNSEIVPAPAWLTTWISKFKVSAPEIKIKAMAVRGEAGEGVLKENVRWMVKFLNRSTSEVRCSQPVPFEEGYKIFVRCPNEEEHTGGSGATEAAVFIRDTGYGYKCHHSHCGDKDWEWFREECEGEISLDDPRMPVEFVVDEPELVLVLDEEEEEANPRTVTMPEAKAALAESVEFAVLPSGSLYGVWASQVTPTALQWLWPDRIPLGKITLWTGMQDTGKTLTLCDIIARLTRGLDWPDGSKNTLGPRKVMLAASEDDAADTLVPRLIAAGADLTQIAILKGTIKPEVKKKKDGSEVVKREKQKFAVHVDAKLLKKAVEAHPDISLLVLDPLISFMGDVDQNKDKEIRPLMDTMAKLCQITNLTIVGLIHLSKRSDVNAIQKVQGASSLVGSARAVWGISRDTEDKTLYHLALVKGNLAKKRTGMTFKVEGKDLGNGIDAPYVIWGEESEADAEDLMQQERNKRYGRGEDELTAVDVASLFLKDKLAKGEQQAVDMYAWGEAEGITAATFKRAKIKVGVHCYKGRLGRTYWSLTAPVKTSFPEDAIIDKEIVIE